MNTDALFYRLFETNPETLFLALGMSPEAAQTMAEKYRYQAIEFKETSHRADGVFQPREPGLPVYFVETQFYPLPTVHADILVKAYTYLKQNDPAQPYCGVVLFGRRALEPAELTPYQPLLDAEYLRPIFVNELPELPHAPLGLSILRLIGQPSEPAAASAKSLVARAKREIEDSRLQEKLLDLIETVIIYKLPRLSREEIQAMLEVHDIRETRVYQEALEEGREEGQRLGAEKERERILQAIPKLAARGLLATDIAEALNLELSEVNRALGAK